ncbi:selenoprotein K [Procambarus clarkii]|uniref:selenoprotein K n=1 Tax=Procambarus clarkii TaxID=6728 RepID=UPI001E6778D3|nr:selenoprotein K-like [Procambarus clarkii]
MPYISSDGTIGGGGGWGISTVTDFFWGFVNFIVLFFRTLISPGIDGEGGFTSSYNARGRGPPPGPPRRRMGRLHGSGGPDPPPMAGGG